MMSDPFSGVINETALRKRLLEGARIALEQRILPSLPEGQAVLDAQLILRTLEYISITPQDHENALLLRTGLSDRLLAALRSASGEPELANSGEDLERQLSEVVQNIGPAGEAQAALLRDLSLTEASMLQAINRIDTGGAEATYMRGKISASGDMRQPVDPLSAETVERWLSAQPEFHSASLSSWKEIPGGFNKRTVRIELSAGEQPARVLALRSDMHPNPTGFSVVDEYPVLQGVTAWGGIANARPFAIQKDDPAFLAPFMLSEFVAGNPDATSLDQTGRQALAHSLAETLARLHRMPITQAFPDYQGGSAATSVHDELERWYSRWRQWRIEPNPALEAAWTWLRANNPVSDRPATVVHGDVGLHNMLVSERGLEALLDWEFCHVGDPIEDLIYCKPFLELLGCWPDFRDAYEQCGGFAYDPRCEPFYEIWPSVRNGSGCNALFRYFLTQNPPDLRFGIAGAKFMRLYETEILGKLAGQAETAVVSGRSVD